MRECEEDDGHGTEDDCFDRGSSCFGCLFLRRLVVGAFHRKRGSDDMGKRRFQADGEDVNG